MPWNPSDLLRNGLSTASGAAPNPTQILNKPVRTLADLTGAGPAPQTVMDISGTDGVGIFRFPNESLMYYMKITTRKYTRAAWNQIGTSSIENTVVLPMAMNLIDNQNVKYSDEPLGVSGAIGLGLGATIGNFQDTVNQIASQSAKDSLLKAGSSLGGAAASTLIDQLTGIGAQAAKGILASAGLAQNEFLTVMLEGPNYKQRDFQWTLSPNSPDETQNLRKIIQIFNNAQAPTLFPQLGYAFFQYPRIFNIEFMYKNEQSLGDILYRMRPMVLINAQYNYTPHGVYAPFAATQGPNAVELRLSFQELELWVNNSDTDQAYKDGGPSTTSLDTSAVAAALSGAGTAINNAINNFDPGTIAGSGF